MKCQKHHASSLTFTHSLRRHHLPSHLPEHQPDLPVCENLPTDLELVTCLILLQVVDPRHSQSYQLSALLYLVIHYYWLDLCDHNDRHTNRGSCIYRPDWLLSATGFKYRKERCYFLKWNGRQIFNFWPVIVGYQKCIYRKTFTLAEWSYFLISHTAST